MKLLSLNGGGTGGYMSLYILYKLEEALGDKYKPYQIFDMIAGVSTGAIIGGLLSKGLSAKETLGLYREFIPHIFGHKRNFIVSLFRSQYSREELSKICHQYLDYDIKEAKTKFMAYAVNIDRKKEITPVFWKSWKDTIKVYDVALASSAAPTFFDPYGIGDSIYIDGGMACNNPSTCCIAEALRCGATLENTCNLNISCRRQFGFDNPKKLNGLLDWAAKAVPLVLYANSDMVEYQGHSFLGFNNHCISPNVSLPMDCQDFTLMEQAADAAWQIHKEALIEKFSPDK